MKENTNINIVFFMNVILQYMNASVSQSVQFLGLMGLTKDCYVIQH